jgi:hypothetical protein
VRASALCSVLSWLVDVEYRFAVLIRMMFFRYVSG